MNGTDTRALSLLILTATGGRSHALPNAGELSIGRDDDCDVVLDDAKASRRHALIRIHSTASRVEIVDLASSNGTLVGDRRVDANIPTDLGVGAPVTIGSTVIIVQRVLPRKAERVFTRADFKARAVAAIAGAVSAGSAVGIFRIRFEPDAMVTAKTTARAGALDVARTELLERALAENLDAKDVVGVYVDGTFDLLVGRASPASARSVRDSVLGMLDAAGFVVDVSTELHPPTAQTTRPPPSDDEDALARLAPVIARIAAGKISVLVVGETGVGKEVMARRIHALSPRAAESFVAFNCAAISETLLESELFGHERGAFSGAAQTKPGLIESANGGTVFLDEIGELPVLLQSKLLRVVDQREVLRVGARRPRPIDVRFVAATNRDLELEIAEKRFREDLYFRLNGATIVIPPLRERTGEIEPLARAFAERASRDARRPTAPSLAPEVLALFESYPWPGNVRELKNVVERAVLLAPADIITLEHVPFEKMRSVSVPRKKAVWAAGAAPTPARPAPIVGPDRNRDERTAILAALEACTFNQTQAAKVLGISRRTLVARLDEYGLPRPRKLPS